MSTHRRPGFPWPPLSFRRAIARVAPLLALALVGCASSDFKPPDRQGPPALVQSEGEPQLWLLLKQEESRQTTLGTRHSAYGELHSETYYHLVLDAHDTRSTARKWTRHLRELKDDQGGHAAEARILGQDGDVVWLFLADRVVGVSGRDGAPLIDGPEIERRNPSLRGLLSRELEYYAFDGALVITTADARRYRVSVPGFAATPYTPASEEAFERARAYSTTWGGAFETRDFLVRLAPAGAGWLGLFTPKEAADAARDEYGRNLADPSRILDERGGTRRTFWSTTVGRTREFPEGAHDRFMDFTPVPGGGEFLEGGLMVKAGTRQPLHPGDTADLLVLHRTRIDAEGRLALTRLDDALRPRWSTTLPIQKLGNRFEFPDRLLLYGGCPVTTEGATTTQDLLMTLQLTDGALRAWNVTLEGEVGAVGAPAAGQR